MVVVGDGPVGLLMAHELRRHGVERVRIVDAGDGPSVHSKAMGLQPRTLELLGVCGLRQAFVDAGRRILAINIRSEGKVLAHLDLSDMESPTPWLVSLPQSETEQILLAALRDLGVEVEWGTRLSSLEQDVDGVTASLEGPDSPQTCRARWLLGCDGAHSTTRDLLGMDYLGEDIGTHIAFMDARASWDIGSEELSLFLDEDGFCLCVPHPEDGLYRFIGSVPEGMEVRHELAWFRSLFESRLPNPPDFEEVVWMTDFVVRQRKVERYRDGRVFLAGDAAHCHSPLGARGLNTGLQDAWNLAWKLALVDAGRGSTALLDSYTPEREPVAAALLSDVGRNTRMATLRHPVARSVRNTMMNVVTSFDAVRQALGRNATQLDILYPNSPIVAEAVTALGTSITQGSAASEVASVAERRAFAGGPQPGDRAPDASFAEDGATVHGLLPGRHHTLLLFDGAASTPAGYQNLADIARFATQRYQGLLEPWIIVPGENVPDELEDLPVLIDRERHVHERYGAASECLFVLRPDGHVGFRSQPASEETLTRWLELVFLT